MDITYKTVTIIILLSLFVFLLYITNNYLLKNPLYLWEGLTQMDIDKNSPLYSHSVNLPMFNDTICNNFCGPKSQCAITREQCTSDIDCSGCNPSQQNTQNNVTAYDATGKLGQQGLQYSQLTTGFNNHNINFAEIYPGSKDAQIIQPYEGVDNWKKSFNVGLDLYNKTRESSDKYNEGISNNIPIAYKSKLSYYEPNYPLSLSATGMFYETTPPASNATIS